MKKTYSDLISKIEILEADNALLEEKAKDTLLFGLAAEIIYQTEDSTDLIDQIMKRISILKNIPFCACLQQIEDGLEVEGFYTSIAEIQKNDFQISFPEISEKVPNNQGHLILENAQFESFCFSFLIPNHPFQAVNALIIPCYSKSIPQRFFIFLDDNTCNNRFPELLMILKQIVHLAAERLENIFIFYELNRLNCELDQRVKERTEELIQTNKSLTREIHERKIVEKTLYAKEQKLRSVYNAAIDIAFITFDLSKKFIVRSFSPGAQKMFGYSPDEIIGKSLDLSHLPNVATLIQTIEQDFRKIGWSRMEEFILRRKSGEYFTVILTVYPLFDDNSKLTGALAVCNDISKLKHTQHELLNAREKADDSEYKFRTLFDQASDGIFINDNEGNYLEVNTSACEMLGYSKDELLKLNLKDIILKENLEIKPVKKSEMLTGKIATTDRILVRKDGSVFPAEIRGKILTDGRMQGIVRDITERIRFENELIVARDKAEENDRLKTSFLQNMSHEIRTPLNAIMGFADLLPVYFDDEEKLVRFANIIKQKGSDLIEIITDILDISQIESGQLPYNPEECKMRVFFAEIKTLFQKYQHHPDNTDVKFYMNIDSKIKALEVVIDQVKLKQILNKLVRNAFKFTTSGKIEIGCSINQQNVLTFYVSDTGIGIPKEKHAEIFNRFSLVRNDATRLYGGTGIGLSIVKGLLDLMGGKIWFESERGKGSIFYFNIPVTLCGSQVEEQLFEKKEFESAYQSAKILVVEVDEYNTVYLNEILSDAGFSFLHSSFGQKAIELCSKHDIHLVMMDMWLPDITGFEVIRQIKKINQKIKIIVQTGYATPEDREKAFDAGCDDYLSKPIKRDALLSRIDYHLKQLRNQLHY